MGAVVVVLLIACANLAGLGLARAPARMREVALRMALGAGRRRVLRQLVTEVLVLAFVGGMIGVALAWWCVLLLVVHAADRIPRATEIAIDGRAIAFALVVTILAGVLAALLPALRATGGGLRVLIGNDRTTVRGGRGLPGSVLVAAELALALVLLAAGGLLVRSFQKVVDRDLGFDPRGVVTAEVALSSPDYVDSDRRLVFWRRLLERTKEMPGVEAAGLANWIPTGTAGGSFIEIEGRPESRDGAGYRAVSAGYFETMGIPLVDGRMFDDRDSETSERVAVINRAMAERYWPGGIPLGARVRAVSMESVLEGGAPWITIVGIVGDVRHWGYENDPQPEMYTVFSQVPVHTLAMNVVARAPLAMVPRVREALRGEVRSIDPTVAPRIALLDDRVAGLLGERRLTMNVLTGFAVLALLLAAIGVYGLLSFAVAQRTREIGVRTALGAGRSGIIAIMLGSALRVVLAGAVAGIFGAWAVTRLMGALLFDVSPLDPLAFAAAVFVLVGVSVGAALIPTWRATRVDPLVALRQQ
jgi:putative ABC transport system permease protein